MGEGVVRGQLCLCSGWGRWGMESEEASGGSALLEHRVPSSAQPPAVPRCWLPTKRMAVNKMAPWGSRVPPQAVGVLRSDCTGVPGGLWLVLSTL